MDRSRREERLGKILGAGFQRAAAAFASVTNRQVNVTHINSFMWPSTSGGQSRLPDTGNLYVLSTQLIGDISGKTFLIVDENESDEILRAMDLRIANPTLNEAFLMEIDHVISSSVLAEFSNALAIEVYTDLAELTRLPATELHGFLRSMVGDESQSTFVVCRTTFQFGEGQSLHAQIIWSLCNRIFASLPLAS